MQLKTLRRSLAGAVLMACCVQQAHAQSPILKIDLNMSGRQESEVNEPGYTPWPVDATSLGGTFEGVTVTLSQAGSVGTGLRANWYKGGIADARLANDGATVDEGNDGGAIRLTLSGLEAGEHTLLVYLNTVDNIEGSSVAPVDISVDGELVEDNLAPTNRVAANSDAQTAYLRFTSTDSDVELLFEPDTGAGADINNVMINGFELNTPDAQRQAKTPVPADGDLHANAEEGELRLEWTAADGVVSHRLYFGTDQALVAEGDESVLIREQAQTFAGLTGLYSMEDYYWRVDEVEENGTVTQGNVWHFRPRQLAFPGAEGYGRFAIGGRGGKVVKVTTLNDSGPGSLRAAVENEEGPRTILFDVAGMITLDSRLSINDERVTVAGQTAPGKGIVIRSAPFGLSGAEDVIMQHVRVRLGAGETYDGIGMAGSDHAIVDHSSISWTIDEAFSSRNGKNITLQRTLISEALNVAGHSNYPEGTGHGYAASISGDIGSFHHNLLAHNAGRNWSLAGGLDGDGNFAGRLDIFNNVVYNWHTRTTDGGAHEVNFVNNYYKPGPATDEMYALNAEYENFPGTQQYYCAGNVIPDRADESNQDAACRIKSGRPDGYEAFVDDPFFPSHATVQSAGQAYKSVLSDVGATAPRQDDQDIRVINETLDGDYSAVGSETSLPGIPDHQDDVGGYEDYPEVRREASWDTDNDGLPGWWEKLHGTDPESDDGDANIDPDRDGYTLMEEYLQWMGRPHVMMSLGGSASVSLADLFRGYTNAPTYAVENVANGSVDINGNSVVFTPTECGLGSFDVTVTDGAGDTMTRSVNVFADSDPAGDCLRQPDYSDVEIEEISVLPMESGDSDGNGESPEGDTGNGGSGGGALSLGWLALLLVLGRRRWVRR